MTISMFKKTALVAALASFALGASAMETIDDAALSTVSGQDGVSIAADLHVNIGEFKYTDTDANGGSVSFQGIKTTGTIAATLDIINSATFQTAVFTNTSAAGNLGVINPLTMTDPAAAAAQGAALAAFYPSGSDVVKIAIPEIAVNSAHGLNMSVDAIKMGGATASYGSFAMNDVKLQGTTVYIWAH